jgi:hypothetical protein
VIIKVVMHKRKQFSELSQIPNKWSPN